jgi:hypothetical protein
VFELNIAPTDVLLGQRHAVESGSTAPRTAASGRLRTPQGDVPGHLQILGRVEPDHTSERALPEEPGEKCRPQSGVAGPFLLRCVCDYAGWRRTRAEQQH